MTIKPTYEELEQKVKDLEEEAAGRKHAEEALIETQLRYRDLIESAHDLIQSVRPDGSFAFVNPAWLETLGYGEEELPSLNLFDIIHPDSLQHCQEAFSKIMSGQRVTDIQATFYAKDGREVYVEGGASPRFIEGEVIATHAIFRDLSEHRLTQETLERYVNDLASLSKGATALVELPPEEDIYHVIGKHLKELIGDSIVFVNSFDSASESFCVRQVLGLGEHMETVLKLIGRHPVGMTTPISNEAKLGLTGGKLENVPGGLHELSVGEVPKAICQAIEKLLGLGGAYAMGFAWGGELFGSTSFLMRRGAELKNERIIETFVRQASVALQRRQAEEALRESEERFRTVADFTYDWEYWLAPDGQYIYVSPSCERITGYSPEEFINDPGLLVKIVHPDDHSTVVNHLGGEQSLEELPSIDFRIITRSGEERWINHNCQAVYGADGSYLGRRGGNRDISKRKQMEEELLKIKKLESLGVLAGGIAHQFNNALSSITGHTGLLEMEYPEDEKIMDYAKAMKQSAHRMAHLTSQLLAYARGGKYNPQTMSLSNFVEGALPIIQHTLDPDIRLETDLPQDVMNVEVDRTQMQMVLSALMANSNEAIDPPGRIRISTRNMDIDQEFMKDHPGLTPGSYVCLSIEDDGKGMDEETRNRIFDPFFTTHFIGRGLGMASVYGIIKNHDGTTTVDSEIGKGTVVRIYLPAIPSAQARRAGLPAIEAEQEVEEKVVSEPKVELAMGEGTVLVIEDEEPLVELFRQILERLGYRVLEARTGKEAVEFAKTFDGQIDLALLDIKLPDMDGGRVYPLIMEARPDLKVIVCSGYSIDGPAQEILDAGAEGFIQKPFLIAPFAEKLKEVLEGK